MSCGCKPKIITVSGCDNGSCLKLATLRVGCEDGPTPCGGVSGTVQIDLADSNDVTASTCDVVYSIKKYDMQAFSSVTVTEDGVLTAITSDHFERSKEYEIIYEVDSPCSILSDEASVFICMKDNCRDVVCPEGEHCVCGECEPDGGDIEVGVEIE